MSFFYLFSGMNVFKILTIIIIIAFSFHSVMSLEVNYVSVIEFNISVFSGTFTKIIKLPFIKEKLTGEYILFMFML